MPTRLPADRRDRRHRPGPWTARALALALAAWFVIGAAVADEHAPGANAASAIERYDELLAHVQALRAAIDRTVFDLDALAFELAFEDAATLAEWVEREIHFEPYAGVLRGPEGTLRARAGNALDQAALLARLLNDAGYEARVVMGTLTDADADALLRRALAERAPVPPVGDRAAMEAALGGMAAVLGQPLERLLSELEGTFASGSVTDARLLGEVDARALELETALASAGVVLGEGATERLRDEARSYAWVQTRLSAASPWDDHHPTGVSLARTPEVERVLEGVVPDDLLHRVRIEAWIERKEVDRLITESVMEPWERPAALVSGRAIDYANAPNGFELGPIGTFDMDAVLASTNFFVPYLNGAIAPGGLFFDLDGRALAPMIAGDQAAALVQTVGRAAESAAGALRGIGIGGDAPQEDPDDLIALVGHGLDITLIAPGGEETTYRRWVIDRLGAENRAAGDVAVDDAGIDTARALMRQQRLMVATGALPQGYLLDLALAEIEARRELFAFTVRQAFDGDPDAVLGADEVGIATAADQVLLFDAFDRPLSAAASHALATGFRAAPSVVNLTRYLAADDTLVYSVDIVANDRRVLSGAGGPALDAAAALRRGVWETVAEREALRDEDAARQVAAAEAAGPFTVLRPGAAIDAAALGLDAEAVRTLAADLERGTLVLLGTDAAERGAWWRVDPVTGTTLGVTADGRGQTMTEYTIKLYDAGFTVMFAVKGLVACESSANDLAKACCLMKAHINNVTGLGFGSVLSSGWGLAFTLATGFADVDFIGPVTGLDCSAF